MPAPLYTIGTVARRSGLTVRALHHYDALGLLCPSHRTDAGHRRYTDADVARLRRLTALRALGLPLDRIGALLDDPAASPLAEVEAHAARVRASIQQAEDLLARLADLATLLRRGAHAPPDVLFHLIHLTTMHESYYTADQMAAIKARGDALGPDGLRAVEQEWAALIARANAALAAGTPPDAEEAKDIARHWARLVRAFTGGDAGTTANLKRVWDDTPDMARANHMDPALMAWVGKAMQAAGVSFT